MNILNFWHAYQSCEMQILSNRLIPSTNLYWLVNLFLFHDFQVLVYIFLFTSVLDTRGAKGCHYSCKWKRSKKCWKFYFFSWKVQNHENILFSGEFIFSSQHHKGAGHQIKRKSFQWSWASQVRYRSLLYFFFQNTKCF